MKFARTLTLSANSSTFCKFMTSASTLTELTNEVTDEATLCEVPLDTESDDDTEDAEDEDAREEMVVY